jgi:hypothetical protein
MTEAENGCGGTFPGDAVTLFQGLLPGEASCTCTCDGPVVTSCAQQLLAVGYENEQCDDPAGQHWIDHFDCYDTFSESHSLALPPATTSCPLGNTTADLPAATWSRSVSLCNGFTQGAGACELDETCVPEPSSGFLAGQCFYQEGDHDCPNSFPNRSLLQSGFEDTRSCPNECDCESSGGRCGALVYAYSTQNCIGGASPAQDLFSGEQLCVAPFSSTTLSFEAIGPVKSEDGTCLPTDVAPIGEISEEGPTTVCCN